MPRGRISDPVLSLMGGIPLVNLPRLKAVDALAAGIGFKLAL